jgi:endonuclease/exonuclease/phosphatase family metal-dependent hydrolase
MKAWKYTTIIVAVVVLASAGLILALRGGDKPWVSKPPANSAGLVRIASFNVEGLFDPEDDPRLSGENDDVPSDPSHLEAIASAILAVDADILALQDVESLSAVHWFNQNYLASMGYTHAASLDVGHDRGTENALLSRYPIEDSRVSPTLRLGGNHPSTSGAGPNPMAGKPLMFRRSPLMTTVDVPGGAPLTLFVIEHKGGDRFDYWRQAEASAVAKMCKQIGMSRRIIILGSFHCDPDDPSLEPYFAAGFTDPLGASGRSEFHATEVSGDRTDFILANRAVGGDLEPETSFVFGGELAERIRSGEARTTHLPVVIELRVHEE